MSTYDNKNNTTQKKSFPGWLLGLLALALIAIGLIIFTDLDLTKTGEMPEVSVEGGEMPAFDVDVADVTTGTKTIEIEVPTVGVDLPKEGYEADDLSDKIDVDVDADVDVDVKPDQ